MKNFTRLLLRSMMLLLLFSTSVGLWGQISTANYTFATNTTGSLALDANSNAIDMSSGTTGLVTTASSDQGISAVTNIGFNFYLMGNLYTQFSVSANGIIQLGSTVVSGSIYVASAGTTTSPKISAFGADLGTSTSGSIKSKVIGTAPNRCLVIEFSNMTLLWTSSYTNDGTFQTRLYESTGAVEFVYGAMSITSIASAGDATVSIGFSTNTTATNFVYVTSSTNTPTTSGTFTDNTTYSTGAITNLNSAADGSRRVYKFTPGAVPADPITMTFTAVTASATTVNWVDNSTTEATFLVTRATDAAFTANLVTATVNSTTRAATGGTAYTSAQTGLSPSTTYYYKVQAIGEGTVPGTGLTGNQATTAAQTYYWQPISGTTNNWSTASNWNTAANGSGSQRTIADASDVLIFSNGGTSTAITSVAVTQTVGQIIVSGTTNITLKPATSFALTLTIAGTTGTDLDIQSGSTLALDGTNASPSITHAALSNNTASIAGTLTATIAAYNTGTVATTCVTTVTGTLSNITGSTITSGTATLLFSNGSTCNVSNTTTATIPLATWAQPLRWW